MSEAARRPRVLGIAGSPRRRGNSDALLDAALAAAREAGADTDLLVVAEAGIEPCRGCNACSKTGACIVRDGMRDVYPRIDAADAFIVATPVYFATVPAVLKALYDRIQPYWARRFVLGQKLERRRPGALIVVGGGGDPYGPDCAFTTSRSVFAVLGIDMAGDMMVHADRASEVSEMPAEIERARAIGASVARLAKAGSTGS